jgi:hypothetical protein
MLAFARDLDVQYKTAFVLAHKLREAMASRKRSASAAKDARPRSMAPISAATSGRRTWRSTGSTGGSPRTGRASDRWWWRCASAVAARWRRFSRPRRMPWRRSARGLPKAPRFMPTRARRGTRCTPASPCGGSTTRMASASAAPAPMAQNPISPPAPRRTRISPPHRRAVSRPLRPGSSLARGLPPRR